MKRAWLSLFALVAIVMGANAQYVFVIANPSGEVRVGKTTDLGAYMDGMHFITDAEPGETIYFDFRPYSGYQFTGNITNDAGLTDITLLDNGLYSFTMPEYEGVFSINIKIFFEVEAVVVEGVDINEDNFPDANFRSWLLSQSYGSDAVITDEEMAGITKISAQGCGIEDLTGIGFFTQLKTLWCNDNQIRELDLTQCPDLRNLQCDNNLLTELDVEACPYLNQLYCCNNQLTTLDVSHNPDLAVLACYGNQLTALDVTNNTLLEQLLCENNQIATITGVANHNKLMLFNCNDNQLTSVDVSGCTALFQLYCYNNKIKGEGMTTLVNSLNTNGGYMVVIDLESETEENEMTDEQVAAAKAKGWSVEACLDGDFVPYPYDPDDHQYVDLGLPSGTLWATCNVGAVQPYQSGLFFAWGDTEGHGSDPADGYLFSWENYKWCEVAGEDTWFTKYCSDSSRGLDGFIDGKYELDPEDDAAWVNWGPQWRMPSWEQFEELRNECTWTRMLLGDVYGYDVEGPNGHSIFLPDTKWRIDDLLLDGGAFWSRTANPEDVGGAYYLGWDAYEWEHFAWYEYGGRLDGQCVRPVFNAIEVTLNSDDEGNYWATFYNDASYTADENATVYTAQVNGNQTKVILTEVADNTIPAGNAVVLKSTTATVTMISAEGVSGTLENNDLQGSSTPIATPADTYMLVKGGNGVGFYHWTGETIPAGCGYLTLSGISDVRTFLSMGTDEPQATGVKAPLAPEGGARMKNQQSVPTGKANEEWRGGIYDLQGRRVMKMERTGNNSSFFILHSSFPKKGIYIINGKKFVVK